MIPSGCGRPRSSKNSRRRAPRSPWSRPRTSCACCSARAWSSTERPSPFLPRRPTRRHLTDNGIEDVCDMVGMAVPEVYSAELSEFVFAAGVKLLASMKPDLMYLSTTDYMQHKYAPGSKGANSFYAMMDGYLGRARCARRHRGDRGRSRHEGQASAQRRARRDLPAGCAGQELWRGQDQGHPAHHRSLCACITARLGPSQRSMSMGFRLRTSSAFIAKQPGIDVVLDRAQGCARFELPEDRMGDIIVVSGGSTGSKVIGTSRAQA